MNEIIGIIVASVICWLNFVIIDTYFGLPQQPGVKGVQTVGDSIEKRNGDIAGGFFQGNILCSPDASAGTLIASIGYMILGIPGGILAAFFVFMGNRLCADPGYAGTTGSLTITVMLFVCSFVGLTPEMFIAGICIAILTIQGIDQVRASIILGKIIIGIILIYVALRALITENRVSKLLYLNVIGFGVPALIALVIKTPFAFVVAAAFFICSTISANAIATSLDKLDDEIILD